MYLVDLHPLYVVLDDILSEILKGITPLLFAWIMFVFHKYITPYLGAKLESKASEDLNRALQNGMTIALNKLGGWETAHSSVQTKSMMGAWAANYALEHSKEAVASFGLTPDQLVTKALAYLPPPPMSGMGTTGAVVKTVPVEEHELPLTEQ